MNKCQKKKTLLKREDLNKSYGRSGMKIPTVLTRIRAECKKRQKKVNVDDLCKLIHQLEDDIEKLKTFNLDIERSIVTNGANKVAVIKIKNPDELSKLLTQLKENVGKLNDLYSIK